MTMNTPTRIVLIGPMGAGKSTIGRRLARALGLRFIDSDQEIERQTGADIPLIFELEGEAGFRKREQAALDRLTTEDDIVLATGGGAILSEINRQRMRERSCVVYLETPVGEQLRRTRHDRNRPLLQTDDPRARLEELMQQREPLYRQTAHLVVSTAGGSIPAVVKAIMDGLEQMENRSDANA